VSLRGSSYVIKLGTMLFTMVEPTKGHEVEYNRWYERDHFYGGVLTGAWSFSGDRFVATRELKDLPPYPAETPMTPDPLTGSYPRRPTGARRSSRRVEPLERRHRQGG